MNINYKNNGIITEDYQMLLPPLGIGSFGEVRKALHKISGVLRAIKIMAKDYMSPEEHDRK